MMAKRAWIAILVALGLLVVLSYLTFLGAGAS